METLYFNPIFEAAENHRYGTADYDRIDPMLGCNEDFSRLCDEAHKRGMRVMLDGVFNHTGFVSRYFNGDGFYPDVGACQSWDSPYRSWFQFIRWPDQYESWWGIYSLPAVNESDPSYRRFIFGDEDSVVRRWLRAGADGWRLDVADELPDDFVAGIHAAARAEKPSAVVIGEVWEDGSTKVAYGVRRKHILGGHCDGLMNYPLRSAILSYFSGGKAEDFVQRHGDHPGELSPLRLLLRHELPGHPRHPPYPHPAWCRGRAPGPVPGVAGQLPPGGGQRRRGEGALRAAPCCCSASPAPPPSTMGTRRAWRASRTPSTAAPTPGVTRTGSCWTGLRRWGPLRREHPALRRGTIHYVCGDGPLLVFARADDGEESSAVRLQRRAQPLRPACWTSPPTSRCWAGCTVEPRDGGLCPHPAAPLRRRAFEWTPLKPLAPQWVQPPIDKKEWTPGRHRRPFLLCWGHNKQRCSEEDPP